ncbi:Protein of unknown function [Gryllus bimaculatus]|nr:Protein of unknown function [Gryllus bimaculatus]
MCASRGHSAACTESALRSEGGAPCWKASRPRRARMAPRARARASVGGNESRMPAVGLVRCRCRCQPTSQAQPGSSARTQADLCERSRVLRRATSVCGSVYHCSPRAPGGDPLPNRNRLPLSRSSLLAVQPESGGVTSRHGILTRVRVASGGRGGRGDVGTEEKEKEKGSGTPTDHLIANSLRCEYNFGPAPSPKT